MMELLIFDIFSDSSLHLTFSVDPWGSFFQPYCPHLLVDQGVDLGCIFKFEFMFILESTLIGGTLFSIFSGSLEDHLLALCLLVVLVDSLKVLLISKKC